MTGVISVFRGLYGGLTPHCHIKIDIEKRWKFEDGLVTLVRYYNQDSVQTKQLPVLNFRRVTAAVAHI